MPLPWVSRPQPITHLFLGSPLRAPTCSFIPQTPNHIWSLLSIRSLGCLPEDHERPHVHQKWRVLLFLCPEPAIKDSKAICVVLRWPHSLLEPQPGHLGPSSLPHLSFMWFSAVSRLQRQGRAPWFSLDTVRLLVYPGSFHSAKGWWSPWWAVALRPCSEPRMTVILQPLGSVG